MITEWTLTRELSHENTAVINELLKSTFITNNRALKKAKPDFMNKETQETKNCRLHGGKLLSVKDEWREFKLCRFEDYSGINEKSFYRGREDINNIRLLKKLRPPKKAKKHE